MDNIKSLTIFFDDQECITFENNEIDEFFVSKNDNKNTIILVLNQSANREYHPLDIELIKVPAFNRIKRFNDITKIKLLHTDETEEVFNINWDAEDEFENIKQSTLIKNEKLILNIEL